MMKDILKLEIQTICIVHIVAIILSIIFFMMFYIKANKDYALKAFLVMQVSMIGWMVFKIFKTVSPNVISRWWFIVGYYVCACVFEVAFLEFGYAYYKGRSLPNKVKYPIYTLSFLQIVAVITNPYHHMFYATYDFWGDSFGILFYIHTLIVYTFIAVGFVYCYKTFKIRFQHKNRWYKYFISGGILVPLIFNFLYITKVIHRFVFSIGIPVIFDITPIVFTWSTLAFVYATFKHDFLNLSPIMKHEIVHKLDTPICVLGSSCDVIYVNEKLESIFDDEATEVIQKTLNKEIINELKDVKREIKIQGLSFIIFVKEVYSIRETQYLIILRDITTYRKVENKIKCSQKDLNNSNKELKKAINTLKETSKIGARNYVARELHDIIGHSLVVAIKLLEVAKLYYKKDKNQSIVALYDASSSIGAGIENMNTISLKERMDGIYTGELLKKDLRKLFERIKNAEIKTNLHFKGVYYKIDEKVFDIIKKVCTELITNSLKHSGGTEIFISVNIKRDSMNILVMDNGNGCDNLIKGNGLNGIEERLKLIGGNVDFISSKHEGFMSKISI